MRLMKYLCVGACALTTGCATLPPEAVLEGDWLTMGEEGTTAVVTFNDRGVVVKIVASTQDGMSATLTVENSTTTLDGNMLTFTFPTPAGQGEFEGTLSADQNTITGSLTREIDFEDGTITIPEGDITLNRIVVDQCAGVTCEDGETCVDGECVATDPCDGVTCGDGETCVDGECVATDPCDGVTCGDGETCVDGECVPDDGGAGTAPTLVGLDANKSIILPFTVQAAYNDDTMFFHMSWEADRGDTHDYFRYTNGAWQSEGGVRRDAQATIDDDPLRGSTSKNSTIYESRATFMLDDPNGPNQVADFGAMGCMLTCHDNSRAMPLWVEEDGEVHKYLPDDHAGRLDLWHHRLGRANPIGASDDQWVGQRTGDEGDGGGGSRHGDAGDGPYQTGSLDADGNPSWAFDADTTGGVYAFQFDDLFTSPLRFFAREDSAELGPTPISVGIDFADAVASGYTPSEGDTVPRRRLRQPTESRGDISATGTTFTPSAANPLQGRWDSNIQRALDTGNSDDTALAEGNMYNIGFAVHTGMVTVRDHYVSFAKTLSLGGGAADIEAVKISGSGTSELPDFSDTAQFPVTDINLFLPGITSWEFLTGLDEGLEFIDPATDEAVNQFHPGASSVLAGISCTVCHTAASSEGSGSSGAMETLTRQRGGIFDPTPLPPG